MAILKKYVFLFAILLSITFISAFGFDVQSSNSGEFGFPSEVLTETSYINSTNHSDYWDTNDGDLDDINTDQFNNNAGVLELVLDWFTDRFFSKNENLDNSGYNITADNLSINTINFRTTGILECWNADCSFGKCNNGTGIVMGNITGESNC